MSAITLACVSDGKNRQFSLSVDTARSRVKKLLIEVQLKEVRGAEEATQKLCKRTAQSTVSCLLHMRIFFRC